MNISKKETQEAIDFLHLLVSYMREDKHAAQGVADNAEKLAKELKHRMEQNYVPSKGE